MNDLSAGIWPTNLSRNCDELCITPLCAAVGAEVTGVQLQEVTDADFSSIYSAWLRYSALLFRDQYLSDDDLLRFSRRLGDLDVAPVMENGRSAVADRPEIYVISNIVSADGRPIGSLGNGEAQWHTDMSYLDVPPDASLLYALEVPKAGGNTAIAGMTAALRDLPEDLLQQLIDRSIKHDGTYNSGGLLRHGVRADDNPMTSVGTTHPIVCTHPESGDATLYLGRRRNAYIPGLTLSDSECLLDRLWQHATDTRFVYEHQWQPGDLLMWDNRCTLHRRGSFSPDSRRLMHRTQVRGRSAPQRAILR